MCSEAKDGSFKAATTTAPEPAVQLAYRRHERGATGTRFLEFVYSSCPKTAPGKRSEEPASYPCSATAFELTLTLAASLGLRLIPAIRRFAEVGVIVRSGQEEPAEVAMQARTCVPKYLR